MSQSTPPPTVDEQGTEAPTVTIELSETGAHNMSEAAPPSNTGGEARTGPDVDSTSTDDEDVKCTDGNVVPENTDENLITPPPHSPLNNTAAATIGIAIQAALHDQGVVHRVTPNVTVLRLLETVEHDFATRGHTPLLRNMMLRLVARIFSTQALVDFRRWDTSAYVYRAVYQSIQGSRGRQRVLDANTREFQNARTALAELSYSETLGAHGSNNFPLWMMTRVQLWDRYSDLQRRTATEARGSEQGTTQWNVINLLCSDMIPADIPPERSMQIHSTLWSDFMMGASLDLLSAAAGRGIWHMLYDRSIMRILSIVPTCFVEETMRIVLRAVPNLRDIFNPLLPFYNDQGSDTLTFEDYSDDRLLAPDTRRDRTMQELLSPASDSAGPAFAKREDNCPLASDPVYNVGPDQRFMAARRGVSTNPSQDDRRLAGGADFDDNDLNFNMEEDGDDTDGAASSEEVVTQLGGVQDLHRDGSEGGLGEDQASNNEASGIVEHASDEISATRPDNGDKVEESGNEGHSEVDNLEDLGVLLLGSQNLPHDAGLHKREGDGETDDRAAHQHRSKRQRT